MKNQVFTVMIVIVLLYTGGCAQRKAQKEIGIGDELFASEKYNQAIAHYTLAKEAYPESCIPEIKKGDAYLKLMEWQNAKNEFLKVLEICPDSLSVFNRFNDTLVPVVLNDLEIENDKVIRDSLGAVKSISLVGLGITDANCLKGIEVYRNTISTLMLSNNELENIDLTPLTGFENIKILNLNSNKLKAIDLAPLSKSTILTSINLADNAMENIDLKPLINIDSLKSLNLEKNNFTSIDLQVVSNLKNLSSLRLQFNNFSSEKCKNIVDYIGKIERFENFVDPCKKPEKKKEGETFLFYAYAIAYNYMDGQGYGEWKSTDGLIPIDVNFYRKGSQIIIKSGDRQVFSIKRYLELKEGFQKFHVEDDDGILGTIRIKYVDSAVHFYVEYSNVGYVYECSYY